MTNYTFTIEVSVTANSDEAAYEKVIELVKPLYGMAVKTVDCAVNDRAMSKTRFEAVKEAVISGKR